MESGPADAGCMIGWSLKVLSIACHGAGASQLPDESTDTSSGQRQSSEHTMNGRTDGGDAAQEHLLSAQQLREKLGGTAVATQLVQHLCGPITMVRSSLLLPDIRCTK